MTYKYGDIIKLKDGVKPQMCLDIDTFFNLPDDECRTGKTFWGLPEEAFETDDSGSVYLKADYAKRLVWCVDDVTVVCDELGSNEHYRLNINVAYDPEGVVNCGAFCSYVDEEDVERRY